MKLALGVVVLMFVAILLNEVRLSPLKSHSDHGIFLIFCPGDFGGIFIDILSPSTGIRMSLSLCWGLSRSIFSGRPKRCFH